LAKFPFGESRRANFASRASVLLILVLSLSNLVVISDVSLLRESYLSSNCHRFNVPRWLLIARALVGFSISRYLDAFVAHSSIVVIIELGHNCLLLQLFINFSRNVKR